MQTESNAALARLVQDQLSFRGKAGHLLLMLAATGGAAALVSLLATEPGLPGRTIAALWALVVLNCIWAGYAGWVLRVRRTLLAHHRVVAGRITLGAATGFTLGSILMARAGGLQGGYVAAAIGVTLMAAAALVLHGAKRERAILLQRRAELEARLA